MDKYISGDGNKRAYSVRFTDDEKEVIDMMAKIEGKSFTDIIRDSVLSRISAYRRIIYTNNNQSKEE